MRPTKNQALPQLSLSFHREILIPEMILPSEFLRALRHWFVTAEFGANLTIKIAAGRDEHGFSGVLMCANAEGINGTLYTILSCEDASQLAHRLEQRLLRASDDPERLNVYSGIVFALREATKSLTLH